ncbi:MAG: Ppx/GppA family phosphatase [bacterium]|jgi:exopolyphosphatase/guanosine-5'-triphosphate,3'-diphosphate pyrophosphatase|nr:Ppx/GppA family phosphatase [candidate division KSB1 bacterium]MDH7561683.1 Ppx/GppA family phosphatase [bacterium]
MGKVAAAIDIGTNSLLLLVAEVAEGSIGRVLVEDECITRLGRGLQKAGALEPRAIEETVAAVCGFVAKAREMGAEQIRLAATSAARDAANAAELAAELKRSTGLPLRVLAGDEEAELTFLGVTSTDLPGDRLLRVVDVGGGSTEFIQGCGKRILRKRSLEVGHLRLSERFLADDPPRACEVTELKECVRQEVLEAGIEGRQAGEELVGVGGTITTLAAIDQRLASYEAARIEGHVLSVERVRALRQQLQELPLAARVRVVGLAPARAPVIVAGAAIFEALMSALDFDALQVTTRGLRHGLLVAESGRPAGGAHEE